MAQAGGSQPENLGKAIAAIEKLLTKVTTPLFCIITNPAVAAVS